MTEVTIVREFLGLQRSVRLSGEYWTKRCDETEAVAFAAMDVIAARLAAADEALTNALSGGNGQRL